MNGKTIGNLILMTLVCVVIFIVFMAMRPARADDELQLRAAPSSDRSSIRATRDPRAWRPASRSSLASTTPFRASARSRVSVRFRRAGGYSFRLYDQSVTGVTESLAGIAVEARPSG